MIGLSLVVLCLWAPQAEPPALRPLAVPGLAVAGAAAPSELRSVAWRDQPRTRGVVSDGEPGASHAELREPFRTRAATRLPPATVAPPGIAPALREPFAEHPSESSGATADPPQATSTRSTLREPFTSR